MQRRDFLAAAISAATLGTTAMPAATDMPKQAILEIRTFKIRNTTDNMAKRTTDFFKETYLPALQRHGVGPIGIFNSFVAQDSPFVLSVMSFPNIDAWDQLSAKMAEDKEYRERVTTYRDSGLGYVRMESSLFRAFAAMPQIEVPPAKPELKGGRVFELRTYESNNLGTLQRKIKMFADGEIAIFKKLNMSPVFFGECIAGRNMPNLTYMLCYDDLAMRDKVWGAFGSSPEWQKLRSTPGLSDAEIVS